MRRPALRRQQPGVALFPFLAVLICTMGSLIVLLVLVVQQARKSAAAERLASEAQSVNQIASVEEAKKKAREEAEDIQWRAEVLQTQREEYAADLAKKRLELAHLEDHLRRLEDQAKRLQALAKSQKTESSENEKQSIEKLAALQKKIAAMQEEAENMRREAAARKPAYAILPYDGPNGTNRRPIYIECLEEGIILQPEGIVLHAVDFQGPLGPGNPLDASLRTVREHFARDGRGGEPYPLVIVRPDGATAFGACRAAMKHWENEFGYELVSQDMQLAFPAADARLAEALQRTIRDARSRQAALAAAMPSRFTGEGKLASFRSGPPPEMVASEESGGGYGGSGSARAGTTGGGLTGGPRNGGSGTATGPTTLAGNGGGLNGTGGQGTPGGTNSGRPGGGMFAGNPGGGTSGASSPGTGGTPGQPGGTSGTPGGNALARNTGGTAANIASPYGSSANGGGGTSPGGTSTNKLRNGSTASGNSASGSNATGSTNGGNAGSGASQSAQPSLNVSPQNANTNAKAKRAIAQRGENWGLPVTSDKAVGIRRPIRMECAPDRLTIVPERGDAHAPLVIPMERGVENHLEPLLESVWSQMDRWGIAVLGGYWKPVLSVDVAAGGDARFEELRTALQGSGIEVERRRR